MLIEPCGKAAIEELDNYLVCSYLNNKLYPEKKGDKNAK
jgi:hypothetical protein